MSLFLAWPRTLRRALFLLLLAALLAPALPQALRAQTGAPPTRNWAISLAVAPGAPDRVLAGSLNAPDPPTIYRSSDGGLIWSAATSGMIANISIAGLVFDPQNARVALAADGGVGYLFRSEDGGANWLELPGIRSQLSESSAIGELYATVENNVTTWYASTRFDGVFRSQDAGNTWTKLDAGLVGEARRVREVTRWRDILWAGTHDGVYSWDTATSQWIRAAAFPAGIIVFSMMSSADTLYAGTGVGIYYGTDGQTWTAAANFPVTIVYDLIDTGRNLVAATEAGLWTGTSGTWQQALVNGAPYSGITYALANTPLAPRTIYAGTELDWVLRSDDEGMTFASIVSMPALDVRSALATPTPTFTPTPPPTNTPTQTPTYTPSPTPTNTPTPTFTPIPTDTPTPTPLPTATNTPTSSPPPTNTPEGGALLPTATLLPTDTPSPTNTPLPTNTPVPPPTQEPTALPAQPTVEVAAAAVEPGAEPPLVVTVAPSALPTSQPINLAGLLRATLPPLFMGLGLVALGLLISAAVSILRGPRDL